MVACLVSSLQRASLLWKGMEHMADTVSIPFDYLDTSTLCQRPGDWLTKVGRQASKIRCHRTGQLDLDLGLRSRCSRCKSIYFWNWYSPHVLSIPCYDLLVAMFSSSFCCLLTSLEMPEETLHPGRAGPGRIVLSGVFISRSLARSSLPVVLRCHRPLLI